MSVVNNIQGTLTQTQFVQQLNQQQVDQTRIQQAEAQAHHREAEALRHSSVAAQQESHLDQLNPENKEKKDSKNRNKKRTLPQSENTESEHFLLPNGGSLINTLA